jgi:4-carboxymuconolactone decarboxylase
VKTDELLRRLALNDEQAVRSAIGAGTATGTVASAASLDDKTRALVRLGALLSLGAATVSCRATVELARAAGATDEELVGVLLAVGPAVGAARLVTAAPLLALAIDYDVEDGDAPWPEGA